MIQAAVALMSEKGVDAMTTREVAARSGASERTLFKHFETKQGLVQAVVQVAVIGLLDQTVFPRIRSLEPFTVGEFEQWHRAFLTNRIAGAEENATNYQILFRELFRDQSFKELFVPQWIDGVFAPLAAQFERMTAAGILSGRLTPAMLAGAFFSLNIGYLVSRFLLVPERSWSSEPDCDQIIETFRAMLTA